MNAPLSWALRVGVVGMIVVFVFAASTVFRAVQLVTYTASVQACLIEISFSTDVIVKDVVFTAVSDELHFAPNATGVQEGTRIVFSRAEGTATTRSITIISNPLSVPGFTVDMAKSTTISLPSDHWYAISAGSIRLDEDVMYRHGAFSGPNGPVTMIGQQCRGF